MAKVVAALTMSLDGFIAGLGDHALGVGVQVSDFQGLDAERASGRYNFRRLRSFYDNREWYSKKVFSAGTLSGSLLSARLLPLPPSDSPDGPDETMMAPVTALARYMAHPDGAVFPPVFADDGLVIVENFPPYIFNGKDAAEHCAAGYRKHVERLRELKCDFGKAHDFDRNGDRVYFVLPTTWRGLQPGSRFEEHGTWAFVLAKSSGQWRIIAYGWGANDETDWPMKTP